MNIEKLTKADFDYIQNNLPSFWGERDMKTIHHTLFLYEFGDTAYVIREGNGVVAYLWGFIAQTSPTAYSHLLGVRESHRRKGLAKALYRHFIEEAKVRGCTKIKAITAPENTVSIHFHRSLGMKLLGEPGENGVPVVQNYRGPGQHRVVFEMAI